MASQSGFGARIVFGTLCHLAVTLCWGASVAAERLSLREAAPGIFVHEGHQAVSEPGNGGDIANIGFIVGERCVAVIDSGGSRGIGAALRRAVRSVTPLPICYVINTHVHPDHVFGNAAFQADTPVFVGHARLAAALAARGANYRNALRRDLGEGADSEIVPPTLAVGERHELDLGGRVLELQAWPVAHTDNDLTVFDRRTGTWWLADLLFVGHTPVVDGSIKGWLLTMERLAASAPRQVIVGHGRGDNWRQALADQQRYLRTVLDETRAAIRAGRSLAEAVASVGLDERERWLLFENFHRRNVTAVYTELEWEEN